MELIPVLDLAGGRAVHARGGDRARYAPLASVLLPGARGDAPALARAYARLGAGRAYVADLDAIGGASPQEGCLAELCSVGPPGWLVDAGARTLGTVAALGDAAEAVLGLESLEALDALGTAVARLGPARVWLGLDLRDGRPLLPSPLRHELGVPGAAELARQAWARGVCRILVLDLARVGADAGPPLEALREVRAAVPAAILAAGGGIRGPADLAALAELGCSAVLVGTALHDGRLGAAAVAATAPRVSR